MKTAVISYQSDLPCDASEVTTGPTRRRTRVSADLVVQEWSVSWFLHGDPPDGLPRILAVELIAVPDASGAREGKLAALYRLTLRDVPKGSALSWMKHNRPTTRYNAERRVRQRLANLKRRLAEKYPLFADEFLQRELTQRPDYFKGAKDTTFRDQSDAETTALYDRLLSGDMGMTIYYRWWPEDDGRGER